MKRGVSGAPTRSPGWAAYPLACALLALSVTNGAGGQAPPTIRDWDDGVKYSRGQTVVPVFEGWIANPDGTFSLVFGYFNRNWEETVFLPLGADNKIEPGNTDQGQPTVFTPRRGKNLFEIVVPKDFGKKEVVWTLTTRGKTERAFGSLVPQSVVTRRMVLAGGLLEANAAAGDDDTGDERSSNRPPTVAIDPVPPLRAADRATVTASIADDGLAPSRLIRGPKRMRVEWSTYRGPAAVAFEPRLSEMADPKGGKATTVATFTLQGTYLLRATATDIGGYTVSKDVTVVVK
jgi:hypothetical protein